MKKPIEKKVPYMADIYCVQKTWMLMKKTYPLVFEEILKGTKNRSLYPSH